MQPVIRHRLPLSGFASMTSMKILTHSVPTRVADELQTVTTGACHAIAPPNIPRKTEFILVSRAAASQRYEVGEGMNKRRLHSPADPAWLTLMKRYQPLLPLSRPFLNCDWHISCSSHLCSVVLLFCQSFFSSLSRISRVFLEYGRLIGEECDSRTSRPGAALTSLNLLQNLQWYCDSKRGFFFLFLSFLHHQHTRTQQWHHLEITMTQAGEVIPQKLEIGPHRRRMTRERRRRESGSPLTLAGPQEMGRLRTSRSLLPRITSTCLQPATQSRRRPFGRKAHQRESRSIRRSSLLPSPKS